MSNNKIMTNDGIKINEFISMFAFDNESDFFRKVKCDDAIAVTNKISFEETLNNFESRFSMIELSIIGEENIENNKDKILEEYKRLSADMKWIIVRYVLPKIEYIYDTRPRIVGWKTESKL